MEASEYHPFSSRHAREKYLKAYDNMEKFWPVPHEGKMVDIFPSIKIFQHLLKKYCK